MLSARQRGSLVRTAAVADREHGDRLTGFPFERLSRDEVPIPSPYRTPAPGPWWRLGLLAVLLGASVVVALTVDLPSAPQLREEVSARGWAGLAVFAAGYAVITLAPVPKAVLSVAAGLLYGLVVGAAVVWAAALIGALLAFALGRLLGRDAVERLTSTRVRQVDDLLARRGFVAVLLARLVPVVPFTAVNYAAGLTGVRTLPYLAGTALGIVPGTVAYVALGAYGTAPTSWPFLASAGALMLLCAVGLVVARRRRGVRGG